MLTDEERAYLANATRVMQIIVAALAGGVLSFFVVSLVIGPLQPGPAGRSILTHIAVVGAFVSLVLASVVSSVVIRVQRRGILAGQPTLTTGSVGGSTPPGVDQQLGPLVAGYQTALILRIAVLEGAAFFCLVTYMLERQSLSLVAAGVLLLAILAGFPTPSKVEDVIEGERRAIAQLRQMG